MTTPSGYFPSGLLGDPPQLEPLLDNWFSEHLRSMGEAPLYPPSKLQPFTIRFQYLPTWDNPYTVRVSECMGGWRFVGVRTDGDGGFGPGAVTQTTSGDLSAAQGQLLVQLWAQLDFWNEPVCGDVGCDGDTWVLEAVEEQRYHIVYRWCPHNTPFARFGSYLAELGGFRGS